MTCLGFCSVFGRSLKINDHSYHVVRRIGEGGFSYVDLVTRQGSKYALALPLRITLVASPSRRVFGGSGLGTRLVLDHHHCHSYHPSHAHKQLLLQVPEQYRAVEEEIRVQRMIQHPNVIQLIDSDIRDHPRGVGHAYLLFPYYRNGTLQDMIDRTRRSGEPIPEDRILQLFLSVCRGLHAMHTCGAGPIAHRDVKPGNMLLANPTDELVLMDLGSATDAECTVTNRREAIALQELCAQTCTAHFRAPELFEVPSECTITAAVDIWSLGCSLYATAFGQSPCDGSALSAISGRITFPKNHSYSSDFCDLVRWLLQVEPASRPTAAEVEAKIATLLASKT